jgi:hypothetical protein
VNDGSFSWLVPNATSTTCFIKGTVTDSSSNSTSDMSDKAFTIRIYKALPDLTISEPEIIFSDPIPTEGDTIVISAIVHNVGDAIASNVVVDFYCDNKKLDTKTISLIQIGNGKQTDISWSAIKDKHIIKVSVSNPIGDMDLKNNEANKTITVNAKPSQSLLSQPWFLAVLLILIIAIIISVIIILIVTKRKKTHANPELSYPVYTVNAPQTGPVMTTVQQIPPPQQSVPPPPLPLPVTPIQQPAPQVVPPTPLPPPPPDQENISQPSTGKMCPNCGQTIIEDWVCCAFCGMKLK